MLTRSSKGHGQIHRLQSWWHAQSRSLHQRLILLTVVVLLLSAVLLLHSIATKDHANEATAAQHLQQRTPSDITLFRSTTQNALTADGKPARKQTLINLAPPLSRSTLGHATWSMLHTTAALFPESPSLAKQSAMRAFLTSLGELYPCATCARHYRLFLAAHPLPDLLTRDSVAEWLCNAHNGVNERTDKPIVDCSRVHDMWPAKLEQDCGCGDEADAAATGTSDSAAPAAVAAPQAQAAVAAASDSSRKTKPSGDGSPLSAAELAAAIAAQTERDERGARKAALVDEEEREQRLAVEEDERQKQRERAAGLLPPQSS